MEKKLIDALLAEREGYVRRGKMDRVAQIDALLKKVDVVADEVDTATVQPADERAIMPRPRKRKKA
jgi:hypothetical protein